ncbi:hypothetical protein F4823DRAFT_562871 [Ustulina deusta]|nr:hypothetical protein F4823DRAFT_562871 [Ustulina deusta]
MERPRRSTLPVAARRQEFLDVFDDKNSVVTLTSDTRSGKTIQIPQYILDGLPNDDLECKLLAPSPAAWDAPRSRSPSVTVSTSHYPIPQF